MTTCRSESFSWGPWGQGRARRTVEGAGSSYAREAPLATQWMGGEDGGLGSKHERCPQHSSGMFSAMRSGRYT